MHFACNFILNFLSLSSKYGAGYFYEKLNVLRQDNSHFKLIEYYKTGYIGHNWTFAFKAYFLFYFSMYTNIIKMKVLFVSKSNENDFENSSIVDK